MAFQCILLTRAFIFRKTTAQNNKGMTEEQYKKHLKILGKLFDWWAIITLIVLLIVNIF